MREYGWLVLMLIFLAVEAACPIHLVSIWFAAGSLVAMLAAMMGASSGLQTVLFFLVSGVLLAMMWPLVRKYLKPKYVRTNLDSVIGSQGLVTEDISNVTARGQVKLGAMTWTARSTSGEEICAGTLVQIDRIEGVKVFVTPVKIPAEVK